MGMELNEVKMIIVVMTLFKILLIFKSFCFPNIRETKRRHSTLLSVTL